MQGYLLGYSFLCFTVGIACLGALLVWTKRTKDPLARAYLLLYLSLSLLVMGALLRSFLDILADPVTPPVLTAVEYLDSIIGRYGLLFSFPFFAHRLFGIRSPRRDYLVGAIVLVAVVIQHFTEYWIGGVWDDRGDLFEDVLTVGFVIYVFWLGFSHLGGERVHRPLARWFLILLTVGLPGIAYDVFLADDSGLKFYPLFYCFGSIVITTRLLRQRPPAAAGNIPPHWELSAREAEVARLVQLGRSNKQIAEQLHISPNTVKTHLRAVFDKSGVRSRFELISATRPEPVPEAGPGPVKSR